MDLTTYPCKMEPLEATFTDGATTSHPGHLECKNHSCLKLNIYLVKETDSMWKTGLFDSVWNGRLAYHSLEHVLLTSCRRHQMETISAILAFCAGNSPVTSEFPSQRPVTRSFDVFNIRLSGWYLLHIFYIPETSILYHTLIYTTLSSLKFLAKWLFNFPLTSCLSALARNICHDDIRMPISGSLRRGVNHDI